MKSVQFIDGQTNGLTDEAITRINCGSGEEKNRKRNCSQLRFKMDLAMFLFPVLLHFFSFLRHISMGFTFSAFCRHHFIRIRFSYFNFPFISFGSDDGRGWTGGEEGDDFLGVGGDSQFLSGFSGCLRKFRSQIRDNFKRNLCKHPFYLSRISDRLGFMSREGNSCWPPFSPSLSISLVLHGTLSFLSAKMTSLSLPRWRCKRIDTDVFRLNSTWFSGRTNRISVVFRQSQMFSSCVVVRGKNFHGGSPAKWLPTDRMLNHCSSVVYKRICPKRNHFRLTAFRQIKMIYVYYLTLFL